MAGKTTLEVKLEGPAIASLGKSVPNELRLLMSLVAFYKGVVEQDRFHNLVERVRLAREAGDEVIASGLEFMVNMSHCLAKMRTLDPSNPVRVVIELGDTGMFEAANGQTSDRNSQG